MVYKQQVQVKRYPAPPSPREQLRSLIVPSVCFELCRASCFFRLLLPPRVDFRITAQSRSDLWHLVPDVAEWQMVTVAVVPPVLNMNSPLTASCLSSISRYTQVPFRVCQLYCWTVSSPKHLNTWIVSVEKDMGNKGLGGDLRKYGLVFQLEASH